MDKNVLRAIAGVEIYPLISFAIFFLFFLGLLVYVAIVSRQHVDTMKHLPLLSSDQDAEARLNGGASC